MKKYISPVALLLIVAFCIYQYKTSEAKTKALKTGDYDYFVDVIAISDGDSFTGLTDDGKEVRFRIQGIDAPELSQAFSQKSKNRLADLIFGKRVGVKVQREEDGFGRPVVYVFTPDNLDVGAEMLKAGMAWHFKKYDNSDYYAGLEDEARNRKVGLWRDQHPVAPWTYRAN